MNRRLFNVLAVMSLLLCVTVFCIAQASYGDKFLHWYPLGDDGKYRVLLWCAKLQVEQVGTGERYEMRVAWPVTILAILPILWLLDCRDRLRHSRKQRLQGRCLVCGYDLRASPACCAECGKSVEKPVGK